MIDFSRFLTDMAMHDDTVGIAINPLIKKTGINAYATTITAGRYIGCHAHEHGEEWYVILSGSGDIWTGDVEKGKIKKIKKSHFSRGCVFCIHPQTAHQLVAKENVELIFLCPTSHINHDRTCYPNLFTE
ncbi:cupin domain-containing protein [Candidatus Symbiopectobacterium sp. NZEC135]|uniref:cupin domain-containing protein n=1 Tax=Candidatus Symbiopectobacterium sp. NZEC135 TaxID=2820471 RepID=UPI0022271131|nr:cupin domain-containing protein [Candidatus Symbiopectobacterium sp. NZEC135]MCW2477833.1 cupin domain-containing protein [Candidatus Symbiopectobacterium sp. NZEC135]